MTLTIDTLSTRCRASQRSGGARALVHEVALGSLAREFGTQLGPSLERLPPVVRLQRLHVKVSVSARDLSQGKLASAWARALVVSLHGALAHPSGDGAVALRRYPSAAAYQAALIHHIATRGFAPAWEFPELAALSPGGPRQATLVVLTANPALTGEILVQLDREGWLPMLLTLWDELALERLMQILATHGADAALSLEDLFEIARQVIRGEWRLPDARTSGRAEALRLWSLLARRLPVRALWHGMRLLAALARDPAALENARYAGRGYAFAWPAWCQTLANEVASLYRSVERGAAAPRPQARELRTLFEGLRPLLPAGSAKVRGEPDTRWLESDNAGVLLLLSVVQRQELWRLARTAPFLRHGGARAVSFLLAAVGMTLLRTWSVGDAVDPVVGYFAGIVTDVDRSGMRRFFADTNPEAIADFVPGETWPAALQALATVWARSFAERVHGFRQASRPTVVKRFLRLAGRVLLEEQRLCVELAPTPWAVALRLSGLDTPLGQVEWLGERRVEFTLQGL